MIWRRLGRQPTPPGPSRAGPWSSVGCVGSRRLRAEDSSLELALVPGRPASSWSAAEASWPGWLAARAARALSSAASADDAFRPGPAQPRCSNRPCNDFVSGRLLQAHYVSSGPGGVSGQRLLAFCPRLVRARAGIWHAKNARTRRKNACPRARVRVRTVRWLPAQISVPIRLCKRAHARMCGIVPKRWPPVPNNSAASYEKPQARGDSTEGERAGGGIELGSWKERGVGTGSLEPRACAHAHASSSSSSSRGLARAGTPAAPVGQGSGVESVGGRRRSTPLGRRRRRACSSSGPGLQHRLGWRLTSLGRRLEFCRPWLCRRLRRQPTLSGPSPRLERAHLETCVGTQWYQTKIS